MGCILEFGIKGNLLGACVSEVRAHIPRAVFRGTPAILLVLLLSCRVAAQVTPPAPWCMRTKPPSTSTPVSPC